MPKERSGFVRLQCSNRSDECLPPAQAGQSYSGTAWLIHEDPNGMVEYIDGQCFRKRAKRITESQGANALAGRQGKKGPPEVIFSPANLEADLKQFMSALQPTKNAAEPDESSPMGDTNSLLRDATAGNASGAGCCFSSRSLLVRDMRTSPGKRSRSSWGTHRLRRARSMRPSRALPMENCRKRAMRGSKATIRQRTRRPSPRSVPSFLAAGAIVRARSSSPSG